MNRLARKVKKLRAAVDNEHGNKNSGSKISVDYFALIDLLSYYDETRDAAKRVIVAREALEKVFFGLDLQS